MTTNLTATVAALAVRDLSQRQADHRGPLGGLDIEAIVDRVVGASATLGCSAEVLEGMVETILAQSPCTVAEAFEGALRLADLSRPFSYERWRHGGWYVGGVRYPSGACGCVSSNYPDRKWRIACDQRRLNLNEPGDVTFRSREKAARAEQALALRAWVSAIRSRA